MINPRKCIINGRIYCTILLHRLIYIDGLSEEAGLSIGFDKKKMVVCSSPGFGAYELELMFEVKVGRSYDWQ